MDIFVELDRIEIEHSHEFGQRAKVSLDITSVPRPGPGVSITFVVPIENGLDAALSEAQRQFQAFAEGLVEAAKQPIL